MQNLYFWGYGTDYLTCIQDFYRLCGTIPMIPRYAFGNWWSRFHKYTEESYRELFPDPAGFMEWLHEQGLHVTLNVHPADGVRAYEEMYETMGRALGMDAMDA